MYVLAYNILLRLNLYLTESLIFTVMLHGLKPVDLVQTQLCKLFLSLCKSV